MATILIINSAEPGSTDFTRPLEKIVGDAGFCFKTIEYASIGDLDLDDFKGIIISGSPQGDDIVEQHKPYFHWLKWVETPVFGICAGHHITGSLFRAQLLRSQEPESGDHQIEFIGKDPILRKMPKTVVVKQMHNDSITLPKDFQLLATAATCKNQLMKHKSKPLYTSQFHPEFYNHDLIRNFLTLCK